VTRGIRCLVIVATIGVAMVAAAPAQACTTLDLGCSADGLPERLGGPVDDVTGAPGGALGPGGEPIEAVVKETVGGANEVIDGVLGDPPLPVDPEDPTEPADPDPERPRKDREGRDGDHRSPNRGRAIARQNALERRATMAARRLPIAPALATQRISATHDPSGGVRGDPSGGLREAIVDALPSLAVLAGLFGLVTAFVTFHAAMDRRDPRLAVARAADEVVRFR
jgi:hypothetical protein